MNNNNNSNVIINLNVIRYKNTILSLYSKINEKDFYKYIFFFFKHDMCNKYC